MRDTKLLTLTALLMLVPGTTLAADGDFDTSFFWTGKRLISWTGGQDLAHGVAVSPSGRVITAGMVRDPDGGMDFGVAALTSSGDLDPNFGTVGKVRIPFNLGGAGGNNNDSARAVLALADERVLVAGLAVGPIADPATRVALVQLTATGGLDSSFSGDGKATFRLSHSTEASTLVKRPGGGAFVAGTLYVTGESEDMFVLAVTATGASDPGFGSGGWTRITFDRGGNDHDRARALVVQPDGKILVGGQCDVEGGIRTCLARLTSTGQLDPSFGDQGLMQLEIDPAVSDQITAAMALDASGRLVVAGGLDFRPFVARFVGSSLDLTFGDMGVREIAFTTSVSGFFSSLIIQPDGRLVLGGGTLADDPLDGFDIAFARLDPDGDLDPSFGIGGRVMAPLNIGGNNSEGVEAMVAVPGRIYGAGSVDYASGNQNWVVVALIDETIIFADGFEVGSAAGWSAQVP